MSDADSECSETIVWLDFAKDCGYINAEDHKNLTSNYLEVGKMLGNMIKHPKKFYPRS